MNKTKKILVTLTLITLLGSLSACGKDEESNKVVKQNTGQEKTIEKDEAIEEKTIEGVTFDVATDAIGVQVGNEFTAEVKINTRGKVITTGELYLNYENLEIISVEPNNLFDVWLRSGVKKDIKEIELIAGKFPPGFNGEEVFATIKARTIKEGEAVIRINREKSHVVDAEFVELLNSEDSKALKLEVENKESEIVE